MSHPVWKSASALAGVAILLSARGIAVAQQPDEAAVIRGVDAAARNRYDHVLGFTVIEHYAVFRGSDETHAVAEMTVRTTYTKGSGKSYEVLSQGGSGIIVRFGLKPLLESEKEINVPGKVEQSWFTSANYEMTLKPGGAQMLNGRDCLVLAVTARRKAPNMIDGTLWVDAKDGSIVRIDGIASKSPSAFAGRTRMMRDYAKIDGFPMATHARAESNGFFGRTVVTIDYSNYDLQLKPGK